MTTDFQPLFNLFEQTVFAILTGVVPIGVAYVGYKLHKWLGLNIDKNYADNLSTVLYRGLDFAENHIRASTNGKLTADMRNQYMALAAQYVIKSVPDALKNFGIDPTTDAGRTKIVEMVKARMDQYTFDKDEDKAQVAVAPSPNQSQPQNNGATNA